MADFAVTLTDEARASGDACLPGEAYLDDTPVLRAHAGAQPDLFLRWNTIPLGISAIDVVVHLHGFSRSGGTMPLSEKVPRSGLDLSRRPRPTLALLPRGNWLRYSWYDFPALMAGGLDRLVQYGLERFAAALPSAVSRPLGLDRLILTAHSGGGMPAVDAIADCARPPDELYVFDGLYGRDPATGDPMRGLDTVDAGSASGSRRNPPAPVRYASSISSSRPARSRARSANWSHAALPRPSRRSRQICAAATGSSHRPRNMRGSPSAAGPTCWPPPTSNSTGRADTPQKTPQKAPTTWRRQKAMHTSQQRSRVRS